MTGLTSLGHILLWLFLAYRWKTVSCQAKVQVGGDALLPCQYSEADPLPETVSVFWRDKDDKVVLDIKKNVPDNSTQNQKFGGRVQTDQSSYKKGNFSIVVKNAQQSDSGLYECTIPKMGFKCSVSLTVSGERAEASGPSGSSGSTVVTPNCLHTLLLLLFLIRYCF